MNSAHYHLMAFVINGSLVPPQVGAIITSHLNCHVASTSTTTPNCIAGL